MYLNFSPGVDVTVNWPPITVGAGDGGGGGGISVRMSVIKSKKTITTMPL